MKNIRYITLSLVLITGIGYAANQPLTLVVHNNNSADVHVDAGKTTAAHINNDDLNRLQNDTIPGHTTHTYILNTTDYPASLDLNFNSANGDEVGSWSYIEDAGRAATCHNVIASNPFGINCTGNDNINHPRAVLSLSNKNSYPVANVNPVTLTVINLTNYDLSIVPQSSTNFSVNDINDLKAITIYAQKQHTFSLDRAAYPAQGYFVFMSEISDDPPSVVRAVEWEYAEENNTTFPCYKSVPFAPYTISCTSNNDLLSPSATVTISEFNQTFPKPG